MGFGCGTKVSQYRIDPASFSKGLSKSNVRYLGKEDKLAILENEGSIIVNFAGGIPRLGSNDYEVAIKLDVAELQSYYSDPSLSRNSTSTV